MNEQNIEKLKSMRLTGFVDGLIEQSESNQYFDMTFDQRISFLIEKEYLRRQNNRIKFFTRTAKFKQNASVEDIDFNTSRSLNKSEFMELAELNWVDKKFNLIITGPTGVGKSFLATALGMKLCSNIKRVYYLKMTDLVREIKLAQVEQEYHKLVTRFSKIDLLIIDEWLRDTLDAADSREILDIIDERYRKGSVIFCSQIPVEKWYENITDPTIAEAILDRVVHEAFRIKLTGISMRKKSARKAEPSLRSDN